MPKRRDEVFEGSERVLKAYPVAMSAGGTRALGQTGEARPDTLGRLRSLAFDGLFAAWTALFGLVIPILLATRARSGTVRRVARQWARGFLALSSFVLGIRYEVRGRDNIPAGPCLIIANHQATWETIAAILLFPDTAIVAKRELRKIPVMGWYLEKSAMIIIDRADGAKALRAMTDAAKAAVAEGRSVMIFPEGSRMPVGTPLKLKRGLELVYRALAIPVLPVALDSGRYWTKNPQTRKPGTITVAIQPMIAPGLSPRDFAPKIESVLDDAMAVLGR